MLCQSPPTITKPRRASFDPHWLPYHIFPPKTVFYLPFFVFNLQNAPKQKQNSKHLAPISHQLGVCIRRKKGHERKHQLGTLTRSRWHSEWSPSCIHYPSPRTPRYARPSFCRLLDYSPERNRYISTSTEKRESSREEDDDDLT